MPFDDDEPYDPGTEIPSPEESAYFWATMATAFIAVVLFAVIGFWHVLSDLHEAFTRFCA